MDYDTLINQSRQNAAIEAEEMNLVALLRPRVFIDGNMWCVLYGDDLMNGVAGFGDSPIRAVCDFNRAWRTPIAQQPAAPIAPVGVEGLVESLRFAASRWKRESDYHASGIADDYGSGQRHAFLSCATEMLAIIDQAALAQQSAAVDEIEGLKRLVRHLVGNPNFDFEAALAGQQQENGNG